MRKIGIAEIEDIALGAALLGAGGGGDPYVGKLVAIGAVKECGPVTLLDPEEVPDDALVVPIAMMGAPTVLSEKAIGGAEYQTLYDTVSTFYGKPIYAFMPIEAGGVNSMLPIAAAARLGLPLVDCDGVGRAFPVLQTVTFTIGGGPATPMALGDEKGNSCIGRDPCHHAGSHLSGGHRDLSACSHGRFEIRKTCDGGGASLLSSLAHAGGTEACGPPVFWY